MVLVNSGHFSWIKIENEGGEGKEQKNKEIQTNLQVLLTSPICFKKMQNYCSKHN